MFVTGSVKTSFICRAGIHFCLYMKDALMHYPGTPNKYLTIDAQICFYRQLFANAVKPQGCISWP